MPITPLLSRSLLPPVPQNPSKPRFPNIHKSSLESAESAGGRWVRSERLLDLEPAEAEAGVVRGRKVGNLLSFVVIFELTAQSPWLLLSQHFN